MLTRLTQAEYEQYAPWAYDLAMRAEHASYPTWRDGIKTREAFMERARRSFTDEEALLFRHAGQVCGWIQWYSIPAENYAQTVTFLVEDHVAEAAAEFAAHVAQQLPGATLDIGVDAANVQVAHALEGCGFTLLERAVNHTLFFHGYQPSPAPEGAARLQPGDEEDFRRLHNHLTMYWNAERILADLPNWNVYLYRQSGRAVGELVCRAGDWPEIFAISFEGGTFNRQTYRALMIACLNDIHAAGHEHMTYFEEDEWALPILAELGFTRVGGYLAYRKEM